MRKLVYTPRQKDPELINQEIKFIYLAIDYNLWAHRRGGTETSYKTQ